MMSLGNKVLVACANGVVSTVQMENRHEKKEKNSANGMMCINESGDMDYTEMRQRTRVQVE